MTFRAFRCPRIPVVQIRGFGKASGLFFEVAYRLRGSEVRVKTWTHVLVAFAQDFGVQAHIGQVRVDT